MWSPGITIRPSNSTTSSMLKSASAMPHVKIPWEDTFAGISDPICTENYYTPEASSHVPKRRVVTFLINRIGDPQKSIF